MYIDKLLPFVKESDFVRNTVETHRIEDIFIPFGKVNSDSVQTKKGRMFNAFYIKPCDILVMNESDETSNNILNGVYGDTVSLNVTYLDYSSVASGINIDEKEDGSSYTASKRVLNGFDTREITTDLFVSLASNYATATEEFISDIRVVPSSEITFDELVKFDGEVNEDSKYLDSLFNSQKNTNKVALDFEKKTKNTDTTFKWLYSYFDAPESAENSRETVPLLIGPTAVFKSATVKELCKEFNYRLVDFRVSFTSRLDYTGLINMAKIDDELFSYSCPMEEIVTCSDGFREYCDRAYRKIEEILERGYLEDDKVSDGEGVESTQVPINGEQDRKLKVLRDRYKDYARTPVLFFDEITRCRDDGVNNVLVELLNKKKLDNMTLYGCKFVAATNANVMNDSTHMELKDELDELYDVNNKIDVAYANRFHPIIVLPEDVMDRWFEWANSTTERGEDGNKKTVTSIHPIILDFLNRNRGYVYNDRPVLDVVKQGLHLNEQRAQTFPNYRTWDMLSSYLYEIDDLYESRVKANPDIDPSQINKEFKTKIIVGLISKWGADAFIPELEKNGYVEYEDNHGKVDDEVGDFLQSSLEAGVPAMLIGPSSMGKTSRVKAYIKRRKLETGKEPLLLDISLASKDAVDLMGMPKKQTLTEYVSGSDLSSLGLDSVGKELSGIMDEVVSDGSYGMVDSLTLRAPSITYKKAFEKAKAEGREVILFFDECNRCTNPSVMSALFETVSDSKFAGVSFKDYKEHVKIIGACNMAYDALDAEHEGEYSTAGSLDPALAARFSVFWKKRYDEYDVKSWIQFMEDQKDAGTIDGTLLEYFKSLDVQDAVQIIASVEDRTLSEAVPSTRALFELSKDIKNMRGKAGSSGFNKSLYNGKVLFDEATRQNFYSITMNISDNSISVEKKAEDMARFIDDNITPFASVWQSALEGNTVDMGEGRVLSGSDLMELVEDLKGILTNYVMSPMDNTKREECETWTKTAFSVLMACRSLDDDTIAEREEIFKTYVGESFASSFAPYFNSVFGTQMDTEITIGMLNDDTLITPFFRQESNTMLSKYSGNTEKMVEHMLDLMREFISVHGSSLPPKNYGDFIMGIYKTLPTTDNMVMLLKNADRSVETMFEEGEKLGDSWIMSVLKCYPSNITVQDVDDMRKAMASKGNTAGSKKVSRTRIL